MSTLLVCYSCRKKYKVPQAPQNAVACKVCGNLLKVVSLENQDSPVEAIHESPPEKSPLLEQETDTEMLSTQGADLQPPRGAIHESPLPTSP
ncbi:MAG: hypothetical protein AABZ60_11550, partial [Planctomycetota bacterium]